MEVTDFITPDLVLSSVLTEINDEEMRKGLSYGFYVSKIQEALEQLSMKTYWDTVTLDSPMPTNLIFDLPKNCFNIKEIYMTQEGCCNIQLSANVYWKRDFNNLPNGQGYTAMAKDNGQQFDPFYQWGFWSGHGGLMNNVLYANVIDGKLLFSQTCAAYPNFRIVYTSMGGNIGDVPQIPRCFRQAIIDFVKYKAFKSMEVRYPRSLYGKLASDTYNEMWNLKSGSWIEAENFIKTSSLWKKNSQEQYNARGNW